MFVDLGFKFDLRKFSSEALYLHLLKLLLFTLLYFEESLDQFVNFVMSNISDLLAIRPESSISG